MPTDREVFDALVALVLEGAASPAELERFREVLRAHPEWIGIYRRQVLMATLLPALSAREKEAASGLCDVGGVQPDKGLLSIACHASRRRSPVWLKVSVAAGLALAGAVFWQSGRREPDARVEPGFFASAPCMPSSSLVLVTTLDADQLDSSELPALGNSEYVSAIELAGGCYTFGLESGVTCVLVGPARLTFGDESRVMLHRGTLLAEVEQRAVGFVVESPVLRARDLGTRFGVSVGRSGATDVLVAQGRVVFEDLLGREVMPLNGGSGVRVASADAFRLLMVSGPTPASLKGWREHLISGVTTNEEKEMSTKTTVMSMGVAAVMSAAMSTLYAGDGAWTGTGSDTLTYWDPANWLDGQIANGAGSAAYFTNALNPKIVLTNDAILGYVQVFSPVAAGPVAFEGGGVTLQGSTLTIRSDNRRVDFRTVLRGSGGFTKAGNAAFYPYRKSEMSGTVKLSGGTLGIDFREDADSTNALALNHLQPDGLVFNGGGQVRVGGRPNRTSDQAGVFALEAGTRRVSRVSGVAAFNLSAGQSVTAGPGVLPDGTFLKSILDDNTVELSAAPLVGGEETLTFNKASFSSVQVFSNVQTAVSGSLYIGLGGDATTVRIGELSGGYGLSADGSATMEVQNTRDFGGVITLTNTLTLALSDQRAIPDAPATNAAFHVDASATNTMTLATVGEELQVTRWNDLTNTPTADGLDIRFAAVRGGFTNPRLLTNALNGLPVVDFRGAGSKSGLVWREALGGIRTVFMVVGSQDGGGLLLGSKDSNTCSFERGMDVCASKGDWALRQYTTPLTRDHALFINLLGPPSNSAWLNGQAVDCQYSGLSGGYDLLSFAWNQDAVGGSASGFAVRGGIGTQSFEYPARSGGQRLAEVLIYQRVLTDQERRDTEAYLYGKWFGKALAGYGAPKLNVLRVHGAGNAIGQAGASPIELDSVALRSGASLTVKANTDVTVKQPSLAGSVGLAGGTLRICSRATPLVPAPLAALHLSATTNLTFSGSEVARWDDCSGGSRYAFGTSGFRPTIVSNALSGLPVVDFGAISSRKFLSWNTNVVIRSLFMVMKLTANNSAPIGTCLPMFGVKSHFTRQVTQIWSPSGQLTVRSGACYLDGERVNPGMFNMTLNSYVLLGQVMEGASLANAFACEAYDSAVPASRAERTGGMQLAEVLIYDRKLSERESFDTQAYLNWKWFGRVSGGYAAPGEAMSVPALSSTASASQSALVVEGDAPLSLGEVSGNGSLLLHSATPVTVGNAAALTGSLRLTNTVVNFSGATTLSALEVLGVSGVDVAGGAPVSVGALTGDGTLTKTGGGVLTVNSGAGFSGSLALREGSLVLGSGGTLNVFALTGSDAMASGGTLAVSQVNTGLEGADVGTLDVSALTLKGDASVTVNVVGQVCDRIDVGGSLSVEGGGSFQMTFESNPGYTGDYTVFTFGNMDAQSVSRIQGWTVAGDIPDKYRRSVHVDGNKVVISISPRGTVMMIL